MAILTLKHDGNATALILYDDISPEHIPREIYNVQPDIFSSVCESYLTLPFYCRLFRAFKRRAIAVVKITAFLLCLCLYPFAINFLFFYGLSTHLTLEGIDIVLLLGAGGITALVRTFLNTRKHRTSKVVKITKVLLWIPTVLLCLVASSFFFVQYMPSTPPEPAPEVPSTERTGSALDIFSILLGSGGIIALVQTFLNTRRGEISVKRNDDGRITEINFKGVAHKEVPELLKEITKSLEKSDSRLTAKGNDNHA